MLRPNIAFKSQTGFFGIWKQLSDTDESTKCSCKEYTTYKKKSKRTENATEVKVSLLPACLQGTTQFSSSLSGTDR